MSHVTWGSHLDTLWDRIEELRWRPTEARRFVIHVAHKDASPMVAETTRIFLRRLAECVPGRRIEIIDPWAATREWMPYTVIQAPSSNRHRVAASRLRDGAAVPALWLEPFSLITIAGAVPDTRLRLCAILAAQASLLEIGEGLDIDVLFEAHRLMGSDLAIACGSRTCGDVASGTWWAASNDDVALDAAIARAAGARPETIPHLRHCARHEIVDLRPTEAGETPPRLHGHVAPAARTHLARLGVEIRYAARTAYDDARRAVENLHRIPQFVMRRWSGAAS